MAYRIVSYKNWVYSQYCLFLDRASHSFAIYFLLNQRLRKFEERRSENANKEKHSFSKLKVIKKAKLSTDNTSGPRSKFTYKGMKIATNSTSQPRLQEQRSRSSTQHEHVSVFAFVRLFCAHYLDLLVCWSNFPQVASRLHDQRATGRLELLCLIRLNIADHKSQTGGDSLAV